MLRAVLVERTRAEQLGLLRELVPDATRFGLLVNPNNDNVETITGSLRSVAATVGVEIAVARARDSHEIEAAFASLIGEKVQALVVGTDPLFFARRVQLATLAARHALPVVYNARDYAEVGA